MLVSAYLEAADPGWRRQSHQLEGSSL
jgi:hypothetical protein